MWAHLRWLPIKQWPFQVAYSDHLRRTKMDGRAMNARKARRDLDRPYGLCGNKRSHRDDYLSRKRADRECVDVGLVHDHVVAASHVTQRHTRFHQRMLKGKRTTPNKSDKIVAPQVFDIGRLLDHLTIAKYRIARNIGTNVQVFTQHRQIRIAHTPDGDKRAGFRVAATVPFNGSATAISARAATPSSDTMGG